MMTTRHFADQGIVTIRHYADQDVTSIRRYAEWVGAIIGQNADCIVVIRRHYTENNL